MEISLRLHFKRGNPRKFPMLLALSLVPPFHHSQVRELRGWFSLLCVCYLRYIYEVTHICTAVVDESEE